VRQGLNKVARKDGGGSYPRARRRREEPPQPKGSPTGSCGLPVKARQPPQRNA
jgi:hypothetical protein